MAKIFLGGTCNGSKWRDMIMPMLKVNFFNPVVENWTKEKQEIEETEKANADIRLYVLTPASNSPFSIAEVIDDSNKLPEKTVFFFLPVDGEKEFTIHELKAMAKIGAMVVINGGKWASDLKTLVNYLNAQ